MLVKWALQCETRASKLVSQRVTACLYRHSLCSDWTDSNVKLTAFFDIGMCLLVTSDVSHRLFECRGRCGASFVCHAASRGKATKKYPKHCSKLHWRSHKQFRLTYNSLISLGLHCVLGKKVTDVLSSLASLRPLFLPLCRQLHCMLGPGNQTSHVSSNSSLTATICYVDCVVVQRLEQ